MSDLEELDRLLAHMADEAPEPGPLPGRLERRVRRARARRYVGIALISIVVAAGVILPIRALLPLADRDKTSVRPAQQPTESPIPADWLPLPADWGNLTGQALASHLGLVAQPVDDLKNCGSLIMTSQNVGVCTVQLHYEGWQLLALSYLLRDQPIDTPRIRARLLAIRAHDLEHSDPPLAADIEWYLRKPEFVRLAQAWAAAPPIEAAKPGQDTYVFSDFSFVYPFVPTDLIGGGGGGVTGATPDPGFASLSYTSRWSGDVYPGPTECEIRLYDASGQQVGRWAGSSDQLSRVNHTTGVLLPVSGAPVRAEGTCAAAMNKPRGHYSFDNVRVVQEGGQVTLVAAVHGDLPQEQMGTHSCKATATSSSGQPLSYEFTLDVSDGYHLTNPVGESWLGATDLAIVCHPYSGG